MDPDPLDCQRPLIAVVGPTGSGKSSLAVELAVSLGGEIVNFDSLQLYRGLDIGTAKTPVGSRRGVPHHLLDVLNLDVLEIGVGYNGGFSAGDYARLARVTIAEISGRGCLPIVVGGSGFYLRALLDGLPALPARDEALRTRLEEREKRRVGSLHRVLTRLDAEAAKRIHARDVHKTIRALEIRMLTRETAPTPETAEALQGYRVLQLGLHPDREELSRRLDARVDAMFARGSPEDGLVEEVKGLLAAGATGEEKPFESLGYKQALQYIRRPTTLEQAISSTKIETRQYAKRQRTWFRRDARIHWLEGFGDDPGVMKQALERARELQLH